MAFLALLSGDASIRTVQTRPSSGSSSAARVLRRPPSVTASGADHACLVALLRHVRWPGRGKWLPGCFLALAFLLLVLWRCADLQGQREMTDSSMQAAPEQLAARLPAATGVARYVQWPFRYRSAISADRGCRGRH